MSAQHTPGPWEWVGRDLESLFPGHYDAVIETTVSCGQFCYGGSVDLKVSDADARLIAAAPDLLALLTLMVDQITDPANAEHTLGAFSYGARIAEARELFTKVRGAA